MNPLPSLPAMTMRWILGPVFRSECLRAARRWQTYAFRSLFVASLLAVVGWVWWVHVGPFATLTHGVVSRMGLPLFCGIVGTQLAVVLLAAPATTAGAICIDRARGTLAHLLVTDISAGEIILGKLAASLGRVLSVILLSLPVLALSVLLGGIDPEAVLGAYLVTAGVAVLGCSLGLMLSVWGRRTHEVLLVNYLIWAGVLMVYPLCLGTAALGVTPAIPWIEHLNPFWLVFAPYASPQASSVGEEALALGICVGISAVLITVAINRLRPVVLREAGRESTPKERDEPSPRQPLWGDGGIGDRPVLWLTTRRLGVSGWMALVWELYCGAAVISTIVALAVARSPSGGGLSAALVNGFQVAFGLLLVGIMAVSKLSEERTRNTLDLLLTTPLTAREIIGAYWWGAFRIVLPLLALPVLVSEVSVHHGIYVVNSLVLVMLVLSTGAALTSLGVGLAVWLSRAGHAVTLLVVIYALITAGWPALVLNTARPDPDLVIVLMASPWLGSVGLTGDWADHWAGRQFVGGILWALIYLAVAWLLFAAAEDALERRFRASFAPDADPTPPNILQGSRKW